MLTQLTSYGCAPGQRGLQEKIIKHGTGWRPVCIIGCLIKTYFATHPLLNESQITDIDELV